MSKSIVLGPNLTIPLLSFDLMHLPNPALMPFKYRNRSIGSRHVMTLMMPFKNWGWWVMYMGVVVLRYDVRNTLMVPLEISADRVSMTLR